MHRVPPRFTSGSAGSVSSTISTATSPSVTSTLNPWSALTDYLNELTDDSLLLSFADIEQILGIELPEDATSLGYWSNSVYNDVARRWWDAGFRSSTRDVPDGHIRFDRVTYTGLAAI